MRKMKRTGVVGNKESGFTLVELLAVVVVLAIILAIAIPAIGSLIYKSRENAHESNKLMIIRAAIIADSYDQFGTVITSNEMTVQELITGGYLQEEVESPHETGVYYTGKVMKDIDLNFSYQPGPSGL